MLDLREKYLVIVHIHQIVSRSFFDVKTISDLSLASFCLESKREVVRHKKPFSLCFINPDSNLYSITFFLKMPKDVFPFRNPLKKNCRLQYAMIGKEGHGDEIKRHARATRQNNAFAC